MKDERTPQPLGLHDYYRRAQEHKSEFLAREAGRQEHQRRFAESSPSGARPYQGRSRDGAGAQPPIQPQVDENGMEVDQ